MRTEKNPAVYITASRYRGTLYVGDTSDLWSRIALHKAGAFDRFTKKFLVTVLVWYEHLGTMQEAIQREKQLKKWNRSWKIRLVEELNPNWLDLHESIDPALQGISGTPAFAGVTEIEN